MREGETEKNRKKNGLLSRATRKWSFEQKFNLATSKNINAIAQCFI